MIRNKPNHNYINQYSKWINTQQLLPILEERDAWLDRPSVDEYYQLLANTPNLKTDAFNTEDGIVSIGDPNEINNEEKQNLIKLLEGIAPWRKGPFNLFGIEIDAEWRSDWKWQRLEGQIQSLEGKNVLDIGCNNGYYLFRMLKDNPKFLLGIDPIPKLWFQFYAFQKYIQSPQLYFEFLGAEHVELFHNFFDVVFCMGILYHRKSPLESLKAIQGSLKRDGTVVVESMGIPGNDPVALCPQNTYGKAKNVFFIPTVSCLENWLHKCGFHQIELLHAGKLTIEEQRKTQWCLSQSLEDFNDDTNENTIEGYPAPIRIMMTAKKK